MICDTPSTTALELSLSEISALTTRAIRGAGRDWGAAEEGANAACWLARAGLDWASLLLAVLDGPGKGTDCPLRIGMKIADHALLPDSLSRPETSCHKLTAPGFLLPFAAQVADRTATAVVLDWDNTRAALVPGCPPAVSGTAATRPRADVTITSAPAELFERADWPDHHHGLVSAAQYARLTLLVAAFTVPSSTLSQAGAGANEEDND
jgi:hypothetical protein